MWDEDDCYLQSNWQDVFDDPYSGYGTDYDFYEDRQDDELDAYRDELNEF